MHPLTRLTDTTCMEAFAAWAAKQHPKWAAEIRGTELWCSDPVAAMDCLSCWIHAWYEGRQEQLRQDSETVRKEFAEARVPVRPDKATHTPQVMP